MRSNHQKSRHLSLPRLDITARVYLAIAAVVMALILTASIAWVDAGRQATVRYENEIDDGLDGFKSDFDQATRNLAALGNWLVGQKNIVDLVRSRDTAGLARYVAPWTEVGIADSITVVDADGLVLSQVRNGKAISSGDKLKDIPVIADALSGKWSSGLGQDIAGRLQGCISLPIYSSETTPPIGALIMGFYLDGSFLQYRSRKLDQEIAIVYDGQMTIITLTDQQGKLWQGKPAPADLVRAQKEGHASEFLTLDTEIGKHLFKFKPFDFRSSTDAGMYGIGVSFASIDRERMSLFRTVGLGLMLIAAGTTIFGFLFARSITLPIRTLESAAKAMAKGDLSNSIDLPRDDELGDLARQLENMRQQLRGAFQSAHLEKSRNAAIIQQMGVAAILTDRNLRIEAANAAAEALLGQSRAELTGRSWHEVFENSKEGNPFPPFWDLEGADAGSERGLVVQGAFFLRARPQMKLAVISTRVEVEGKGEGFVHILQDASIQEQLLRAKDEFIMNAAHELRGPLASLRASIELLIEDYATMGKQDLGVMLRTMQRAVVKFQALVENLIDMGNIQAGRFRVRPIPTQLHSLVEDALAQVNPLLRGRSQSVEVKVDCPTVFVSADRPRIVQVLINLLTNASKYGPEGEPITLSAFSNDGFAVIEVTDHGSGIAPEEQQQLFKRFYRGRRAEEEGIGIGLGLALAREIVQAHGGRMDVRSQVGEGTTFWFTLPRGIRDPKFGHDAGRYEDSAS